jgi:hypothetical protein
MTDLEITRLCAEAMGFKEAAGDWGTGTVWFDPDTPVIGGYFTYAPLHNDVQAMALVKKIGVSIEGPYKHDKVPSWQVDYLGENDRDQILSIRDADLNRAICTCVAIMQQAKLKAAA